VLLWSVAALAAPGVSGQRTVSLPAADRPLKPVLEEVYRVGALDGEDWELFGDLNRVGFDAEGRIYVLDGDNQRVIVFDRDGSFVRQVGKAGDGPGELRMPTDMAVAPDGTVIVQDMGHQAFVVFAPDGSFVRNVRNPIQGGLMGGRIDHHPSGAVLGANTALSFSATNGGRPALSTPPGAPVKLVPLDAEDPEVREVTTAWRPLPEPPEGGGTVGGSGFRVMRMARMRAFDPVIRTGVLPDGRVAVIDTVTYRVRLVDPAGGAETALARPLPVRAVTEADRRAEKARRLERLESGEGPRMRAVIRTSGPTGTGTQVVGGDAIRDMQRQMIETLAFADEFPALQDLRVDGAGRLWLLRTGARVGEPGPIDVVDPSGRYIGTVPAGAMELPDAFGPDGLAAFIGKDDMDVPFVSVRRIGGIER